jgi:hypothetical protein
MPNPVAYNSSTTPTGTFKRSTYTYNEILDILATPEWTDSNPMGGI